MLQPNAAPNDRGKARIISVICRWRRRLRNNLFWRPFVTATIRAQDGEAAQWWKVLAFSETVQSELMCLSDGDALSVQGALKAETYEKDGATRLSLSVVADQVLALRQPRRAKKANP